MPLMFVPVHPTILSLGLRSSVRVLYLLWKFLWWLPVKSLVLRIAWFLGFYFFILMPFHVALLCPFGDGRRSRGLFF